MSREQLIDLTRGSPEGYKIPDVHIFDQTGHNESILTPCKEMKILSCLGRITMPIPNIRGGGANKPYFGIFFFLETK